MNRIAIEQNAPLQIQRLNAQRRMYSVAKRVLAVQMLLGTLVPFTGTIFALAAPCSKPYVIFGILLCVLIDLLWLNQWQKSLRSKAAQVQELFDCDILELPWNTIVTGHRPAPELIKRYSRLTAKIRDPQLSLRDWYPPSVSALPISVARIICQRSNCQWDGQQRRRYARCVIGVLFMVVVLIVGMALLADLKLTAFFMVVVAPVIASVGLMIRLYLEHAEAAKRLDSLKAHSELLWESAMRAPDSTEISSSSRALQDEIFNGRKRTSLVYDWFFRMFRDDDEAEMNFAAEELVMEAKRRLAL